MSWAEIKLALNSTALTDKMLPLDVMIMQSLNILTADYVKVGDNLQGRTVLFESRRDAYGDSRVFETDSGIFIESFRLGESVTSGYVSSGELGIFDDAPSFSGVKFKFDPNVEDKVKILDMNFIRAIYVN